MLAELAALRAETARLRSVLSSITEAYFVLDASYRFVDVNAAAERLIFAGKPASELLGHTIWDVFPAGRNSEFYVHYHEALSQQREVHFEAKSSIGPRWFETHAYPRGGVLEVYVRDITQRKRAEEALARSEREFRALFELAASGKAEAELGTGRFLRVNRKLCEMTGYAQEELLSRSFLEITHPDDRERDKAKYDEVLAGAYDNWQVEKRYVRKDGGLVWVMVSATVIRDDAGNPLRSMAVISDITDRKRAEDAVVETAEELLDADRRKDDFMAMLAHELRNPLAPILTAVQLLRRDDSVASKNARDVIERQVAHMARLVDDLIDVSRVTRGKILLKSQLVDLSDLVRVTLRDHAGLLQRSELQLEASDIEGPLWIDGDPTRLSQIVGNLIQNACKFTDPGGRLLVRVRRDDDRAVLSVEDTGMGIEPSFLKRVFEPFSQAAQGLARPRGGLGLGLSLVKGISEMHGGTARAESAGIGHGAKFTIELPLTTADVGNVTPDASISQTAALSIVLIEDNPDTAEMLKALLEFHGHTVEVAHSGQAGIDVAVRVQPKLVLCDIGLPGELDGYDVARSLAADPRTQASRLVALTGYGRREDQERARQAGFHRHLTKPVDADTLIDLIAQYAT